MSIYRNQHLRMYRKRAQLTQSDMAVLLGLPESSSISHWEKNRRGPAVEQILLYRTIFDVPVESFFEAQKAELSDTVVKRIEQLLAESRTLESTPKNDERLAFLEATLKRLTGNSQ